MHLLLLFVLIVECSSWGNINVSVDQKGGYKISIGDRVWLRSARTAIYVDNKWYSSDDGSLPLINVTSGSGFDPQLGDYRDFQLNYDLARGGIHTIIVGHIRDWYSISGISFYLDTGDQILTNTVPLGMNDVRTVFPSFHIEQIDDGDQRGYFTFEGEMAGDDKKHAGRWIPSNQIVEAGIESGPIVVFNLTQQGEGDMLVLSPFSQFMSSSFVQTNTSTLEYGVLGSILSIPSNYNHSMMVFYSPNGINLGVREWGQLMQKEYNRTQKYRSADLTINYLGYYTDNGGYYYYNTEKGVNYEETMVDIRQRLALPIHYLQLDSWWYFKGAGDGVSKWIARPDIFPDGLVNLHRRLENIPLAAHNRYWSYDTDYKYNYSFALDENNQKALPIGNDSFWADLLTQAHDWGLVLYEQDWLDRQTMQFSPLLTDIHLGQQWLSSMGRAADQTGINIQYCMSLPRHILSALPISRVTQARASTDYAVHLEGKAQQWAIGISSMFLDAIGIAPFKDVFWSTSVQPDAPYKSNPKEVLPEREALIATLSTGPVTPGDAINYTNKDVIMRCCRPDGLIFKPDRPLTMINRLISDWALYNGTSQGELYSTETHLIYQKPVTFYTLFASAMKRDYQIFPSMIGAQAGVIWSYDNPTEVLTFDNEHPLNVLASKCHDLSICRWGVSPLVQFADKTQYAFLGEWNKWTPVSSQRVGYITNMIGINLAEIGLQGLLNERSPFLVYHSTLGVVNVTCPFGPDAGEAQIVIDSTRVICVF
ncbi:unnamed protein product [Adineta ricciae]|uniref:Uncharacterized protein n=1 Tax=Adineta ricciae TaxID=249248 RepID=A0A815KXA6_ADIRI|nr:unnamed protein product [Adineta ricciae]CAF1419502.1 unnamed protein product [Adineta ricciae]